MKKMIALALVVGLGSWAFVTNNRQFEITKNLEIFANLYKELNSGYVEDLEPSQIMRVGIEAMLQTLDPYTNYISESDIEAYRYLNTGKFDGIGARIKRVSDVITITEPFEGGPAHEAGLEAGDQILEVDGTSTEGKTRDQVNDILKGSPGSEIILTIKKVGAEATKEISLERNEVAVKNVPYYGLIGEGDIGYIVLTTFTQRASDNIASALKELKQENPDLKGLVLDLRNNGGGLLREAIQICNIFIDKDLEVVSTRGKVKERDRIYRTLAASVDSEIPLAVLINGNSASASEIVSGVIQDYDRGIVIGQRSYGKGLVQNTVDLDYNARLKLTTSKYYIPSGRCIQSVEYGKDGEPLDIADSLRAAFTTKSGRPVLSGGGVTPDIAMDPPAKTSILKYLSQNDLIFKYANAYKMNNDSIVPAREFEFNAFDDFVSFVEANKVSFQTETEKEIDQLAVSAKNEGLDEALAQMINEMRLSIEKEKEDDLNQYKDEIIRLLESEIVSRYYLRKGKTEKTLSTDPEVQEAIALLKDTEKYGSLLQP